MEPGITHITPASTTRKARDNNSSSNGSSSLTHEAYQRLRDAVLSGVVRPGHKLKIHTLVDQLGVSQGAVREALSRLASEGLVTAQPQRGFRVRPISRAELLDLTQVRIGIEQQCVARAITHGGVQWEAALSAAYRELSRTQEKTAEMQMAEPWSQLHGHFHETLVSACDSPWLLRLRAQLFAQAERYRRLSVPLVRARRNVNAEHRAIVQAALARDSALACELMAAHFDRTTGILLKALEFDEDQDPALVPGAA